MIRRLPLVSANNLKEAAVLANKDFIAKLRNKKQKRIPCAAEYCLLFPIDVQQGYDRTIACENGCESHTLCEGLSDFSDVILVEDAEYFCNKCQGLTEEHIRTKMLAECEALDYNVKRLDAEAQNLMVEKTYLEHEMQRNAGKHEKEYYASLKNLNTTEASYHGGALNGKDCEKVLENAHKAETVNDCIAVASIVKEMPERAKNYLTLFKILANVWMTLRINNNSIDDEDLEELVNHCEAWSKKLPVLFPDRNITRKGHTLSFHVPQYLKKYRTFYRYYKLEQAGESIHATMNKLMRRLSHVTPKSRRLWKIIEHFEMLNGVNKDNLKTRTRGPNKQTNKPKIGSGIQILSAQSLLIGILAIVIVLF